MRPGRGRQARLPNQKNRSQSAERAGAFTKHLRRFPPLRRRMDRRPLLESAFFCAAQSPWRRTRATGEDGSTTGLATGRHVGVHLTLWAWGPGAGSRNRGARRHGRRTTAVPMLVEPRPARHLQPVKRAAPPALSAKGSVRAKKMRRRSSIWVAAHKVRSYEDDSTDWAPSGGRAAAPEQPAQPARRRPVRSTRARAWRPSGPRRSSASARSCGLNSSPRAGRDRRGEDPRSSTSVPWFDPFCDDFFPARRRSPHVCNMPPARGPWARQPVGGTRAGRRARYDPSGRG